MARMLVIGIIAVALAAAETAAEEPRRMESVVVTATKIETPAAQLGSSVSVITDEDLQTYNYGRIEDALRAVPGVEITRQGSLGKVTSISIRGANANQVQVLIDGMRVKSPTLGSFDFANLSIDAIDRIEIVRGPQSTLYGADAIGGIVHIITKKGAGPPSGTAMFEGGSQQTFRERASTSGAFGRFSFALGGSRTDSRGQTRQFNNDDSEQTAFAAGLGVDLPWNASFSATGRYLKSETDVPTQGFQPFRADPDSQQQEELYLFTLAYEQRLLPWWRVKGRMGQLWDNQGFQNGPEPAGQFGPDFAFESQVDTRRREFEVLNVWEIGRWDTVIVGLEHRNERGENRHTFRAETNTQSVFLQNELRPLAGLTLAGGVRYEDNDTFGDETTPRASLAYVVPLTGTKLHGSWGKGFRAPTINDLFFPDTTGFCPPFGNLGLKPERSESWDAGVEQPLAGNRLRLEATYFRNTFRNLITTVQRPDLCFQQSNVGRARTEGMEFAADADPLDWLHVYANYTFTDTENEVTGARLAGQPRHRWNLGVLLTPHRRLSLFVQAHIASSLLDVVDRNVPGYYRLDVGGALTLLQRAGIVDRLDLTLRIENVTDVNYTTNFGTRALGFSALAGLRAHFR